MPDETKLETISGEIYERSWCYKHPLMLESRSIRVARLSEFS